jgi:hypothetical protein
MFYMSGLRTLHYAARDPYSGSVNLLGTTPYLSLKPIKVAGPHPGLETLSVALTLEWTLCKDTRERAQGMVEQYRPVAPAAVALAERLFERGVLRQLREQGASPAEMVNKVMGS